MIAGLTCTDAGGADRHPRARTRPSFPVVPRPIWHGCGTAFAGVCQCLGIASACARSASEVSSSVVQLHPWLCPRTARCKPGTQPTSRLRRWPRVPCQRRPRANLPSLPHAATAPEGACILRVTAGQRGLAHRGASTVHVWATRRTGWCPWTVES